MESKNKENWIGNARNRLIVLACLIVVVTLFWVALLLNTNLPMSMMAGIGFVCLLLLALTTAWTAMAAPRRRAGADNP